MHALISMVLNLMHASNEAMPLNSPKIIMFNEGTGLRHAQLLKFPRADINDKRSRVFH